MYVVALLSLYFWLKPFKLSLQSISIVLRQMNVMVVQLVLFARTVSLLEHNKAIGDRVILNIPLPQERKLNFMLVTGTIDKSTEEEEKFEEEEEEEKFEEEEEEEEPDAKLVCEYEGSSSQIQNSIDALLSY